MANEQQPLTGDGMNFETGARAQAYLERLKDFMAAHVQPADTRYHQELSAAPSRWTVLPVVEELKEKARAAGLWNLFMPPLHAPPVSPFTFDGPGLSNLEFAPLAEEMGRLPWSTEVFNCAAPDTGNMEVLLRYGSAAQQSEWLVPLMEGRIRSAFLMTEPGVASSDATNIETRIRRDGDHYVVTGRKWYSSGVGDPRCKIAIVMGKTDPDAPRHLQQSQILVPLDAPGVRVERMLSVFGYDEAPHGHGEVILDDVRVPATNMILGEGRGFDIAQGRLGPGRIHHCMRTLGAAEVALEKMTRRLLTRMAFGKRIADQSVWEQRVAEARTNIEMARLLCLKAADMMDRVGNKAARMEIAMIKTIAPRIALQIIDDAIQAYGAAGVGPDAGLAHLYASIRTLRLADGPDEIHKRSIARMEFARHAEGAVKAAVEAEMALQVPGPR